VREEWCEGPVDATDPDDHVKRASQCFEHDLSGRLGAISRS
jgi:hypothetical protein